MEHRFAVVVLRDIIPNPDISVFVKVVGAVNKFHELYIVVEEYLELAAGALKAFEPYALVNRRKAIRAAERTSSARFVIVDFMIRVGISGENFWIWKRNVVQVFD